MLSEEGYRIIKGDQKTDEWRTMREGKLTGSVAKKVKGTGNAFLYEMLAVMTTQREEKQVWKGEHVERGNELEPEARAKYGMETEQVVWEAAFIENGRLGISPDGIVFKKGKGPQETKTMPDAPIEKLVEIKCPDTNTHIRYILEGGIPSEHKDQILHGYMTVPDCDAIDFVSYCPMFIHQPLLIVETRRQDFIMDLATTKVAYEKFLKKLDESYEKIIL